MSSKEITSPPITQALTFSSDWNSCFIEVGALVQLVHMHTISSLHACTLKHTIEWKSEYLVEVKISRMEVTRPRVEDGSLLGHHSTACVNSYTG